MKNKVGLVATGYKDATSGALLLVFSIPSVICSWAGLGLILVGEVLAI